MNAELLIYAASSTPRLNYVLYWIFTEQLQIPFQLTTDRKAWDAYPGPKIGYHKEAQTDPGIRIIPHNILQEDNIVNQDLSVNRWKHSTILFYNQPGAPVPFDIFGAVFFLISRYEEYMPFKPDKHGRFPHSLSTAAQFSFLQEPVVDQWLFHFGRLLAQKLKINVPDRKFTFRPTYDVDIAFKYLHKGAKRFLGGLAKDVLQLKWLNVPARLAAGTGVKTDPFYSFDWLDGLHSKYNLKPIYFFLAGSGGPYDRNVLPGTEAMRALMLQTGKRYDTGLHPSYKSHESEEILRTEKSIVDVETQKEVTSSRQHYIKYALPETYRRLIACGITDDYSMGYASANGFRAGTSNAFPWFDLATNQQADLRIHPFAFMDATSRFYNRHNTQEAFAEWERLWHAVKTVNGTFISIWHNHLLSSERSSKAWRALYEQTLEQATS